MESRSQRSSSTETECADRGDIAPRKHVTERGQRPGRLPTQQAHRGEEI